MSPVAEKIKAILALEDDEERRQAAASLMEELPSLLPDDPELAALMEEDLAKAFAESLTDKVTVANVTDANGNNHAPAGSSDGGQFQGKDEAPESQSEG